MSSKQIVTAPFRLAFPNVFEPKAAPGASVAKFGATMLFDNPKDLAPIRAILIEALEEKFTTNKLKWPAALRNVDLKTYVSPTGKDGWPIRDGADVPWDGFEGMVFCRAGSNPDFKPVLVDKDRNEIIDKADLAPGMICRARINAFAYDNSGNKGVSLGLVALQLLKDDGVRFGGRVSAKSAFADDWEDESDDPSNYSYGATGTDEDI